MKITIENLKTGESIEISRDVCTQHPAWVHEQMGTSSEIELQNAISQANVNDWYRNGEHLGPDECGLSMEEIRTQKMSAKESSTQGRLAHNTTTATRWTVIQVGPRQKILGHYATQERAEAARGRYLAQPWGSGIGPIVTIHKMDPGDWLRK